MALIPCPECATEVSERAPTCPKCGAPIAGAAAPAGAMAVGGAPRAHVNAPSGEVTYYSDQLGVRVTNARAIFANKTYSMANLSSVSVWVAKPSYSGAALMIIVGLVSGMACMSSNDLHGASAFSFLIMVGGILWAALLKPVFWVRITASGGDTNAWGNKDKGYIEKVVSALNEAIVHRG